VLVVSHWQPGKGKVLRLKRLTLLPRGVFCTRIIPGIRKQPASQTKRHWDSSRAAFEMFRPMHPDT
jgi:hypothetical protein